MTIDLLEGCTKREKRCQDELALFAGTLSKRGNNP